MAKYNIEMTVNFAGEVEADTEEEALAYFIENREHQFYESVDSESVEEVEEEEDEEEED